MAAPQARSTSNMRAGRCSIRPRDNSCQTRSAKVSARTAEDLAALKRGQVIAVSSRRHRGLALVLEAATLPADPVTVTTIHCEQPGWRINAGKDVAAAVLRQLH